jgi:phosphoinositide-3-kinase, regulatory subunit 4
MVTSWNWVVLTDFAPFKPVFLPDDDPADFNYFFDSSGRRRCYLAPERLG